ncbi:hypothetical protein AALO_G00116120 [Alosa alosa]|uniref:Uncharacterized protein n=1 Tax=Alosa alosa TaxID=278164 RepID=A0AAV6GR46_9TELE|nr:hypothetical protein AALO_G00116120 [Alosa alosa]
MGSAGSVVDSADTVRGWIQHHTNVANASGRTIYVKVRSPGRTDTEQIPAGSSVSFGTDKGQVTLMVYDNSSYDNFLASKTLDSDYSMIVKSSGSGFYIVRAKYGTIWQEG